MTVRRFDFKDRTLQVAEATLRRASQKRLLTMMKIYNQF